MSWGDAGTDIGHQPDIGDPGTAKRDASRRVGRWPSLGLSRPRSGHIYLSLKDEGAVIKAVAWARYRVTDPLEIEDGQEVIARGRHRRLSAARQQLPAIIRELVPRGIGRAGARLPAKIRATRAAEGIVRRHQTAPAAIPTPHRVCHEHWGRHPRLCGSSPVVGLSSRYSSFQPRSKERPRRGSVRGIEAANQLRGDDRPDLLVVGRGGGSLEDLWVLQRGGGGVHKVRAAIPTVSAVGHEIDVCLTDLAADLRAATPRKRPSVSFLDR
ncbi:MAG: exodeoxyribonuclease VII large subunit [Pirellulaceae bacterium]